MDEKIPGGEKILVKAVFEWLPAAVSAVCALLTIVGFPQSLEISREYLEYRESPSMRHACDLEFLPAECRSGDLADWMINPNLANGFTMLFLFILASVAFAIGWTKIIDLVVRYTDSVIQIGALLIVSFASAIQSAGVAILIAWWWPEWFSMVVLCVGILFSYCLEMVMLKDRAGQFNNSSVNKGRNYPVREVAFLTAIVFVIVIAVALFLLAVKDMWAWKLILVAGSGLIVVGAIEPCFRCGDHWCKRYSTKRRRYD